MIKCKTCGIEKSYDLFYKNKSTKTGRSTVCKDCAREYYKAYSKANVDRIKSVKRKYYLANKEYISEKCAEYYSKNIEACRASNKSWMSLNHHKVIKSATDRKQKVKIATPAWLTDEQSNAIQDMYWLSKDLSAVSDGKYHVDHIVPLRGGNVCGLHVPWNLQILPDDINLSKNNRF